MASVNPIEAGCSQPKHSFALLARWPLLSVLALQLLAGDAFKFMKNIVHLLSGGVDSTVMLHELVGEGNQVHVVMFDYKQRHVQELTFAKYHCKLLGVPFKTIEIPQLSGSELTDGRAGVVVPNRNAILLSIAVNTALSLGCELVTYACNSTDTAIFPDCRPEFVAAFNAMLKAQEISVQVATPYIDKAKWWIVGKGRDMGVDLNQTWSCYKGGMIPCGECLACTTRKEAGA